MYGVSRWKRLNDMIPLIKKRVQFEYKEHTEYKGYAINRGYEQRNDMNAHVIVLIEFAMSYCGYMPLTINYAGNSLFMEPYAKQFWLQTCRLKENEHDYKNFVFVPVNNYSIFLQVESDGLIIGIQRPIMIPVCATRRTWFSHARYTIM